MSDLNLAVPKNLVPVSPRQTELLRFLKEKGHVTISDLTSHLSVSEQTIRRDLKRMEEAGLLSRYHGGATALPEQKADGARGRLVNKSISEREISMVREKDAMAREVARLIPDGSSVFITIGTTVERVARELTSKKDLLVITDSLRVAEILYHYDNIRVIIPSGQLSPSNGGIEGPQTIADLGHFRADFFVTSVGAVAPDGTLLDFNLSEVEAAKMMMQNARHSVLVCDHSKYTAAASIELGRLRDMNYFVTDEAPQGELAGELQAGNVKLIVAPV